jgi:hypothetical protein
MADVIAFQLRLGAAVIHDFKDALLVVKGVLEDQVLRGFQVGFFPVIFVVLNPVHHREQAEIDGSHVDGCQLRLEGAHGHHAFFRRHGRRTAGGDANDGIALFMNPAAECPEQFEIHGGTPVLRIPGVQMHGGRPGLGGCHGFGGDLLRCDGKIRRKRRNVDRTGDCAVDDDFATHAYLQG